MLMVMKYKDLVLNDKNCIKKTNKIFKTSVAECMLNRPIRFHKGEMFSVIKYKDFLLDNIDHIKETNKIFNATTTVADYYILSDISISDIRQQI